MSVAREAFLDTMARLLETQGYYATGLNQIVAESRAPKGSLYYYFPDGKEGLTVEVIARLSHEVAERIKLNLAGDAPAHQVIERFLLLIARSIEATDCRGGGPIATVALETSSADGRLRAACDNAYSAWQAAFAERLVADGHSPERAACLSTLIIAAIEGAVILCRTARSAAPMERVAAEVGLLLRAARAQA